MGRIIPYIMKKNVPNHPGKNSKYYIKYLSRLTQITPLFCHTLRTSPDSPAWDLPDDLPDTRPPGILQGKIMGKSWQVAGKILEDLPLACLMMFDDTRYPYHTVPGGWKRSVWTKIDIPFVSGHRPMASRATVRTSQKAPGTGSAIWGDLRINEPSSMAMFWQCWFCGPQNHLNCGHVDKQTILES